eukprot:scaffold15855_cov39-Phaeocystis_antarctica.AAC.1
MARRQTRRQRGGRAPPLRSVCARRPGLTRYPNPNPKPNPNPNQAGLDALRERPTERLAPLAQEEALCECEEDGGLRLQL